MTKLKVYRGSYSSRFDLDDLSNYVVVSDEGSVIQLEWNSEEFEFNSRRNASRITLEIEGDVVDRMTYFDSSGDRVARISDGELDADLARILLDPDVGKADAVYDLLIGRGAKFVGERGAAENELLDGSAEFMTGWGNDVVLARDDDDVVYDRGGEDIYRGGSGEDTLSYHQWFDQRIEMARSGIIADLRKGLVKGPDGFVDRVTSFEVLEGTHLGDVMRGDAGDNEFIGMRGADLIVGRGGFDFVTYRSNDGDGASSGIKARLDKGYVRDGWGDRDTVKNVEGVQGTDRDDMLRDDDGDNAFRGYGGSNVYKISGGDDWIVGGDEEDRFVFRGDQFGSNTIFGFDGEEGDFIEIREADDIGDLSIWVSREDNTIITFGESEILLQDFVDDVRPYLIF